MGYNYQTVLVMARDFQVYEKGVTYSQAYAPCEEVTSQPHTPCEEVTSQAHTPYEEVNLSCDEVGLLPHTPHEEVNLLPHDPCEEVNLLPHTPYEEVNLSRNVRKVLVPLTDYFKVISRDVPQKSKQALYKAFHSGKYGYSAEVLCKGKRKKYYMVVTDSQIIEKYIEHLKGKELMKMVEKMFIHIYLEVPMTIAQEVSFVSSPEYSSYEGLMNFIRGSEGVSLWLKKNGNNVPLVRKKVTLLKDDYKMLLEMAQENRVSVKQLLIAYIISYFKIQP